MPCPACGDPAGSPDACACDPDPCPACDGLADYPDDCDDFEECRVCGNADDVECPCDTRPPPRDDCDDTTR